MEGTATTTTLLGFSWFGGGSKTDNDNTSRDRSKTVESSSTAMTTKGALGGVAGIMDSMESFKKSQRVGKLTAALIQEMASTTVEGTAENGKIKVVYDCHQRPVSVFIDESYMESTDAADVSEALTVALKDAHAKSIEKMDERLKPFFNDLGIGAPN